MVLLNTFCLWLDCSSPHQNEHAGSVYIESGAQANLHFLFQLPHFTLVSLKGACFIRSFHWLINVSDPWHSSNVPLGGASHSIDERKLSTSKLGAFSVVFLLSSGYFFLSLGIHRLKQSMPKRKAGKMARSYDPIAPVAEEISEEACLLCFDEFQVWVYFYPGAGVEEELTEREDGVLQSLCCTNRIYNSRFRWPTSLTPWSSSSSLRISSRTESSWSPPPIAPQKVWKVSCLDWCKWDGLNNQESKFNCRSSQTCTRTGCRESILFPSLACCRWEMRVGSISPACSRSVFTSSALLAVVLSNTPAWFWNRLPQKEPTLCRETLLPVKKNLFLFSFFFSLWIHFWFSCFSTEQHQWGRRRGDAGPDVWRNGL